MILIVDFQRRSTKDWSRQSDKHVGAQPNTVAELQMHSSSRKRPTTKKFSDVTMPAPIATEETKPALVARNMYGP